MKDAYIAAIVLLHTFFLIVGLVYWRLEGPNAADRRETEFDIGFCFVIIVLGVAAYLR